MRIKIVSDGTSYGTRVVDADTEKDLGLPITRVVWACNATGIAEAELTIPVVEVSLAADTVTVLSPIERTSNAHQDR